jgi:hypothetical protein
MFGTRHAGGERPDGDYVLAGLTSAGVLDTAFGQNGMTVVDVSAVSDNPRHLIVDKDGTIVASGYSTIDGIVQPVLVRASATGQIDRSFGTNGVATARVLPGVAEAYSVAKQGDAYIAAGYGRGATRPKVDHVYLHQLRAVGQVVRERRRCAWTLRRKTTARATWRCSPMPYPRSAAAR